MKRQGIKQLRAKVLEILKEYPKARDSDIWLTIKLWTLKYPTLIDRSDPDNPKIALKDILTLPREDNVKRVRAKIQNEEGLYLPTSPEIRKQRKISEEEWKAWSVKESKISTGIIIN